LSAEGATSSSVRDRVFHPVSTRVSPAAIPLSVPQSERLSELTSIDASRLVGRTLAEIAESFRWQIRPSLLGFARVYRQPDAARGLQPPAHQGEAEEQCEWVPLFEIEWATREGDRRLRNPEAARPD